MDTLLFSGVCTALVTPFKDGNVDFLMLKNLIDRQVENGIKSIVLTGTTGESPTLSDSEKREIWTQGKEMAGNRCRIIAGTGTNSTAHTITLSKAAEISGADAVLVVSPYYNKSTEEGLFQHYKAVAQSLCIPVILYNVPSRTGVDIPVGVYKRLAEIPNIIGVKEATTSIKKILEIRRVCPDNFTIWCGNDDLAVPYFSSGAKGVVSVLSNVYPEKAILLSDSALSGDYKKALSIQMSLMPIIDALFCEVNPIPVKEAMKIIGYDCGVCRLPLWEMTKEHKAYLQSILKNEVV